GCGVAEGRADDVALGGGRVWIHAHQTLLVLDGAYGGTDDERLMELRFVGTREVGKEVRRPLTAVAPLLGQAGIDHEAGRFRYAHERSAGDAILKIDVVFDALERFEFNALILAYEGIVSSAKSIAAVDTGRVQRGNLAHCNGSGFANRWRGEWIAGAGNRGGAGCRNRNGSGRRSVIRHWCTGREIRLRAATADGH